MSTILTSVATEGTMWRHHRKITAAPFSERNNREVFRESIVQTQAMLNSWIGSNASSKTLTDVIGDTMRVTLYVISRAGFGVALKWPSQSGEEKVTQKESEAFSDNHVMSYKDAVGHVLHHVLHVIIFPQWWLKNSPIRLQREVYASLSEYIAYMGELIDSKKQAVRTGHTAPNPDLLSSLVLAGGTKPGEKLDPNTEKQRAGRLLSDDEVAGNAWIFMIAGHETTSGTIHNALNFLAMYPGAQRQLQDDLDKLGVSSTSPKEWTFDETLPKLFNGFTAAVMNETLRCIPPATYIPKSVETDQTVMFEGRKVVIPGGAIINLSTVAVQRDPKPYKTTVEDVNTFRPGRWLMKGQTSAGDSSTNSFNDLASQDTSAAMMKPPKGSYVPFSDGPRSCLGKRFAQVEVMAMLATIFREYSVELAVDDYATDEEVKQMTPEEQRRVWQKAFDRAHYKLDNDMMTIITIQLRSGCIPIRLVKRGHEMFKFD